MRRALKKAGTILLILSAALVLCACLRREQPETAPTDTAANAEESAPTLSTVVIQGRIESSYERWLAAAALQAIPMDALRPNYDVLEIYLTGETPLEKRLESKGVYLFFREGEEDRWLYLAPLAAERSEAGTTDMSAADLGWASFTYVEKPELAGLEQIKEAQLAEETKQTLLVSLSRH